MRQSESHFTQITLMRLLPFMNSFDMIVQSLFQRKSLFAMKTTKRFDLKMKKAKIKKKQARKGFRPLSEMKGIRYFQNSRNFLKNCLEIFCNFLRIFLEDFFEGIFLTECFWRNVLGDMFWEDF